MGYAYLQRRDFTRAAEYFKRASELDSKDPRVHYYNALLMAREGGFGSGADLSAMTRELETSISLDPGFADSYALLAFAQSTSGDPAKGVATMRKALAISPRNENYLFNLASLYLTNQQPDQAIAVLQSLQVTDNPELASRVAGALAQAQQFRQMVKDGTAAFHPQGSRCARGKFGKPGRGEYADIPRASGKDARQPWARSSSAVFSLVWIAPPSAGHPDCGFGSENLEDEGGRHKPPAADRSRRVLLLAWSKQKVALNYRETSEGEGSVISLEIQ